jgi:hypothetical protein
MKEWLKKYYGDQFETLQPRILAEGSLFAVVCLKSRSYVLVRKQGSFKAGGQRSLHEGLITQDVLNRMRKALEDAEKEG